MGKCMAMGSLHMKMKNTTMVILSEVKMGKTLTETLISSCKPFFIYFSAGKRHGQGQYVYSDGSTFKGLAVDR